MNPELGYIRPIRASGAEASELGGECLWRIKPHQENIGPGARPNLCWLQALRNIDVPNSSRKGLFSMEFEVAYRVRVARPDQICHQARRAPLEAVR